MNQALAPLTETLMMRARTCPRCDAPANPGAALQVCVHCKKQFVLVAGARLDPAVTPSTRQLPAVKLKYSSGVMRHAALVDDDGISDAELDPVTGHIPVSKRLVPYDDVVTLGIYRRVDWATLAALVLLFFAPVVLPLLVFSFEAPMLFLLSLPAFALFALGLKKAIGIGVQRMRIVSSKDVLTLRFDTPMWKRKKFLTAVLARTGVGDVAWK